MSYELDAKTIRLIRNSYLPQIEVEAEDVKEFLKSINILNPGGSFYKERKKKFHEVISFSSHLIKSIHRISRKKDAYLLDCGCGHSYLSFLTNYILKKMGRNAFFFGTDTNSKIVETSERIRDVLKFNNMEFYHTNIIDFVPKRKVNIVYALHACDTATDEAIAKGIQLDSRYIIVAPCCQRQIVRQISRVSKQSPFLEPLVETKVTKEYVGVAVTETLRRLVLEYMGYKVDMFEFVSTKYTPKNIMLRAEKIFGQNIESLNKYKNLRDCFGLAPKIEDYLQLG